MVNGPLGGSMATPPVAPQPPQVSFETTAQSRGNFSNFLKSIPTTTAMTPIAPLGSAPTMPTFNPMANIDIFNQPTGMMGMNQPPMNPMMQPPSNAGIGLMPNPVQNFFMGGSAMSGGGFSDAEIGSQIDDFDSGEEDTSDSFDANMGLSDQEVEDIFSGGDDPTPPPLPIPRPDILEQAVARAENQVFGDTEGDALGFFNKEGGLTATGQKEFDDAIMANLNILQEEPVDTRTTLASATDVAPASVVKASFRPDSLTPKTATTVLDNLDLNKPIIQSQDPSVIGSTNAELAALNRAIATTKDVTDRQKQLADVTNQTLADRVQLQRGLDKPLDTTTPDTSLERLEGRRDVLPDQVYDSPQIFGSIDKTPDLDATKSFIVTNIDPETYTGPTITGYGARRGGTASGEELDQAPAFGRSPGSLQAQFGDRIGPMLAGLNQTRQDALGALSQQRDFNVPGTFGGILNALGNRSRSRMIDALSSGQGNRLFGGTYNPTPIYQDGQIVGVRDEFGNLMEGRDPFATDVGGDDETPMIRRPQEEEEEKEDEKPPNIIGGTEFPFDRVITGPTSVVVDSPFTSNVPDFVPSTFNTANLNKLIESLTGIPAPRRIFGEPVPMQNGGVINAVDKFLATT